MPADCEIEVSGRLCGVQAIGRCATCGKAFCGSHQARDYAYITELSPFRTKVDLATCCATCYANMVAYRETQLEKVRAQDRASKAALEYLTSGAAQTALRSRGVPSVILAKIMYGHHGVLWGLFGDHSSEKVIPVGRGWLIGEFGWCYRLWKDSEHTEGHGGRMLTMIIDTVHPRDVRQRLSTDHRYPLLAVEPCRMGYAIANEGGMDWKCLEMPEVVESIARLVKP